MTTFNEYLSKVNAAIAAIPYPSTPDGLYRPIEYTMGLGGKRLRPVLVLMACDAFGGDHAAALAPAVGLELFHNFTLLHDDVMDKAPIRRGKPTVHCRWNENTAILSGDAMLTIATSHIAQAPTTCMSQIMELFNATAMEIYEGQQYDMDFENRNDVTTEEYISMIRLKTSVLLGCACKMGAIIAGAATTDAGKIYDFGVNLGLAFQLQDDYLDVYGNEATFGKAIGGDILNNKKTFLLINALSTAQGTDRDELLDLITLPCENPQTKISAVTEIYSRLGVDMATQEAISFYSDNAIALLHDINLPDDALRSFHDFVDMLMRRNK